MTHYYVNEHTRKALVSETPLEGLLEVPKGCYDSIVTDMQFNVAVFSSETDYVYTQRHVSMYTSILELRAQKANNPFRIIITDALDMTAIEWVQGKLVFPPQEMLSKFKVIDYILSDVHKPYTMIPLEFK